VGLLQQGLTRASLNDYRLGRILDALFAANLNRVFSAVALQPLEVYAISTPWLHQDTTTIALYGAYEDEPQTPGASRPVYGPSKDGRADLKQVLLSLGVSHTKWDCKYHVVFIPKYRRKALYHELRRHLRGCLPLVGRTKGMLC
jgi:transposase